MTLLVLIVAAPVGCDYPIFEGAARAWINGESRLYDEGSLGFFYAPWSLLIYGPLSYLPQNVASGLLNWLSMIALLLAVHLLVGQAPWYVVLIAISNIWTANLIGSTQFDALTTVAVAVAYYATRQRNPWLLGGAAVVAGMKPTNVWIPLLLVALGALQSGWTLRDYLTASILPAGALAASFILSGLDWPLRYVSFVRNYPPNAGYNASFWTLHGALPIALSVVAVIFAIAALVVSIRRYGMGGVTVAVGLVLNLMISPYTTIYHYVQMIPAVVYLGRRDALWLVGLYGASLFWVMVRVNEPWLLPIYPLAVSGSLFIAMLSDEGVLT
jgi:alpha-1,2-mannosyltransferase